MKIVIDISEDVYTRLFDNGIQDNEISVDDVCEMARSIRLGELDQDTIPFDFDLYQAGLMDMPKEMIKVLDEIRSEIEEYRDSLPLENNSIMKWYTINYILEKIIDKYKSESG